MTPLDDELRQALSSRAASLAPPADPLAGIEARAGRIRRTRVALAAGGAALAVAAVAVAVPALDTGRRSAPQQVGVTPTTATSPSTTSAAVLDPAHPWPLWGDDTLLTSAVRDDLQRTWAGQHAGTTVTPLLVQRWEPSGQVEVAFVSTGDGGLRVGWATLTGTGVDVVRDEAARPAAAYQFALDGDEGVTRLYVIAAPDSTVRYAADGVTYRDITQTFVTHKDGVGTSTTSSRGGVGITAVETAGARVQVLAADGSVVYDAPAIDTSTPPGNLLQWGVRGRDPVSPDTMDLRRRFAQALNRPDDATSYSPLYVDQVDGVSFTVGQAWFDGDDKAYTVSYAVASDNVPQFFLGPVTPRNPWGLAFLVSGTPGHDLLVVVPRPGTNQVLYAAHASGAFQPVADGASYQDGVALVERDLQASDDRLQTLDGNGDLDHPLFEGPVTPLLCGVKECG
jgi:hypothetical protein